MGTQSARKIEANAPREASEIGLVGNRDVIVEQVLIVLGADILGDLANDAPIAAHASPRLVEGVWVGHRKDHLQHLAVVNDFPALTTCSFSVCGVR